LKWTSVRAVVKAFLRQLNTLYYSTPYMKGLVYLLALAPFIRLVNRAIIEEYRSIKR
jgi:hypothetical protein